MEYGLFWFKAGSRKHTGNVPVKAARQAPAAGLCLYEYAILGQKYAAD